MIKIFTPDESIWVYISNISDLNPQYFSKIYFDYPTEEKLIEAINCYKIDLPYKNLNAILNGSWKDELSKITSYMAQKGIGAVVYTSKDYPRQLKCIDCAPPVLYYKGDISLLDTACVAVIGSRISSSYGRKCAQNFASVFAEHGLTVVSGLSEGIDSHAHWAALDKNGATIAVLACGVDYIYPMSNHRLYEEIARRGLLISELPLCSQPQKNYFAFRNRLVSGISQCLVVAEAGLPSGTMSTVDHALEQNKNVYAIPGSINSPTSEGTNYLIKNGCMCAVDPYDILSEFGCFRADPDSGPIPNDEDLDDLQRDILKLLVIESLDFDQLEEALNVNSEELNLALTMLEIVGYVEKNEGRNYSIIR